MSWHPFDKGASLGTRGSEEGVILRDEEHDRGSRITLERNATNAPYAITCGIYGSMFHTTWAGRLEEAEQKYDTMKRWLDEMLADDVTEDAYQTRLQEFVNTF